MMKHTQAAIRLFVATPWSSPAADDIAPHRSLTYNSVNGVDLKLDVFEPTGLKTNDHRPAIVDAAAKKRAKAAK